MSKFSLCENELREDEKFVAFVNLNTELPSAEFREHVKAATPSIFRLIARANLHDDMLAALKDSYHRLMQISKSAGVIAGSELETKLMLIKKAEGV